MVCCNAAQGVSSPSLETVITSALHTNSLRPAVSTSPRATIFCPHAGARKLILYSTVSTSRPSGARVNAAYPPGAVADCSSDRAVEVALLLSKLIAVGNLDHAPALAYLANLGLQKPHESLFGEAFPHSLERTRLLAHWLVLLLGPQTL